jgi:MoaA/NifB/PqqE/SkfB family radical SAM enzyme
VTDDLRLRSVAEGKLLCGPETLQLNLTNACNLNCIFCWNHSPLQPPATPRWAAERLGDRHLELVLRALPRLRPGRVLLSGRGEPLLHPRAEALLEQLQRLSIPAWLQTNGVAGPEPERLAALGVERLVVNLSAATPEAYERTHPGKGELLQQVLRRLRRLALLAGRPRIRLVAVIQRSNRDQLLPLLDLAPGLGASLELRGMEPKAGLEPLALDPAQRAQALQELARCRRQAARRGVELRAEHLERLRRRQTHSGSFSDDLAAGPCYMGWYYLRVTCDGRVMFCCKDKLLDHLDRRPDLYAIWRAASTHQLRLAGRDGDVDAGLLDESCRACSNFARNRQLRAQLAER